MKTQALNLATAGRIVVRARVYLTCGGAFQMGTVSRIKNGGVKENQYPYARQTR